LSRFAAGDTLDSQIAINFLIDTLKHPDPIVRRDATLALRSVGTGVEAAFPNLKNALRTDPDVEVRRSTVLAIRSIDATQAIPDLIQSLDDSDHSFAAMQLVRCKVQVIHLKRRLKGWQKWYVTTLTAMCAAAQLLPLPESIVI
jgi:HEAT repeat protein